MFAAGFLHRRLITFVSFMTMILESPHNCQNSGLFVLVALYLRVNNESASFTDYMYRTTDTKSRSLPVKVFAIARCL